MKNSAETIDVQSTQNDLHLLDAYLESLSDLTSKAKSRSEYYGSLARNILAAADAQGALVVAVFADSRSSLVQSQFHSEAKLDEADCYRLINKSEIQKITGQETSFLAKKPLPSGRDCFISHLRSPADIQIFFLLVRESSKNESLNQVFADLTVEIANLIQAFEEKWSLRHIESKSKSANQFANMVINLASAKSAREMYFHLANDLSVFTESSRVCVFDSAGNNKACSSVATVSRRSQPLRALGRLARMAVRKNTCLEIGPGRGLDLQRREVESAEHICDGNPNHSIVVTPLRQQRRNFAAVSFENFDDDERADSLEQQTRIHFAVKAIQPVMWRQKRYSAIPLLNVWIWFFHDFLRKPVRSLAIALLIVLSLAGGIALLANMTTTFEIPASGQLLPENRRDVFAPGRGTVERVLVDEGDNVTGGQAVVSIRSIDLEQNLSKTQGELAESHQKLTNLKLLLESDSIGLGTNRSLDRTEISSEIETQKIRIATLESKLRILDEKSKTLAVHSPLEGVIISRNVRQKLQYKPVERGDLLFSVGALDEPWIVELDINESYNAYLVRQLERCKGGLDVRFRVSSNPSKVFSGKLRKLNYIDKPGKQYDGNRFISAEIEFDKTELGELLRIGTGVSARIDCGTRSYLFLLTYELNNKVRSWLFLGSSEK